jgi:hypothetical protein
MAPLPAARPQPTGVAQVSARRAAPGRRGCRGLDTRARRFEACIRDTSQLARGSPGRASNWGSPQVVWSEGLSGASVLFAPRLLYWHAAWNDTVQRPKGRG